MGLAEHDLIGLECRRPLSGSARVPGSKSLAARSLLCAALAEGETRILNWPGNEDAQAMLQALVRAGTVVELLGAQALLVRGAPPGRWSAWRGGAELTLGESGTAARFLTAALALCAEAGSRWKLLPEGSLRRRQSPALFEALREAGVGVVFEQSPGAWPASLQSIGPPSDLLLREPRSSQELSALALAAAAWPDELRIGLVGELPSAPYFAMSLALLRRFGVSCSELPATAHGRTWSIPGPLCSPPQEIAIEPDASAAAVALCAACISDGEVTIEGLGRNSLQGDVRIHEYLRKLGSRAELDAARLVGGGRPTQSAELDLAGEPDLAPPLAILMAAAVERSQTPGRLTGLETLPGKESSRIQVLADGLASVGFAVHATTATLALGPRQNPKREAVVLDSHGDHRIAFAFALLGLLVGGVRVRGGAAVSKSWPGFWEELERLGAVRT